jgi:hypothetical protein
MTSTASLALCLSCGNACRPGAQFCPRCGTPRPVPETPVIAPETVSSPAAEPGAFAAQGQVRQNQTYVGNRLMYTRDGHIEAGFLNVVTGRMVWGHLKRVLVTQAVVWVLAVLVTLPLSVQASVSTVVGEDGGSGMVPFLRAVFALVSIGLLVSAFRGQVQEPMSEWELMLDERSVSADAAYAAIAGQQVSLEVAFGGRVPPVTTASATTSSSTTIGAPLPPMPPLPPLPPAPGGSL